MSESTNLQRNAFQFGLKTAIVIMLLSGICIGLLVTFFRYPTGPIGVLERNRESITRFVETVHDDDDPYGYYMLDVLRKNGARYVFKSGDCVVIRFEFMPTDAVPELIYSPKGYDSLPQDYKTPAKHLTYFHLTKVDENWYFCEWDN